MNTSGARPLENIIEHLDKIITDLEAQPVKTRMRAILITELQKAVAFAREVLLKE